MTVKELLSDRKTIFLFVQHGWTYYTCNKKYYKVWGDVVLSAEGGGTGEFDLSRKNAAT